MGKHLRRLLKPRTRTHNNFDFHTLGNLGLATNTDLINRLQPPPFADGDGVGILACDGFNTFLMLLRVFTNRRKTSTLLEGLQEPILKFILYQTPLFARTLTVLAAPVWDAN